MKAITLGEKRAIQFEMLKEIQDFCERRNIRYSLAYGTLIGAIRHKGFIPWDDDLDIMMPLPDMIRFKEEFKSENIKYCDIDTEKYYEYGFSRLAHKGTYKKHGLVFRDYGIDIDLYPVFNVPDTEEKRDVFFERIMPLFKKRILMMNLRNRIINYLPLKTIPGFKNVIRQYRDELLFGGEKYGTTSHYYVLGGPIYREERERCVYDYDLFDNLIKVEFEGEKFFSIKRYHEFLTLFYGDYMQLPPEEERHPSHNGAYYWK